MIEMDLEYGEGGHADVRFGSCVLSVRGRCGASPEEMEDLVLLRQVHGPSVLVSPSGGESADGMIMLHGRPAPALRVADCVPVFLASGSTVAAFHAGWRGLAAGIASKMMDIFPGRPEVVVIGPSICPECYEVGDDVRDAVLGRLPSGGHPDGHLDLRLAAVQRMRLAGLPGECPVYRLPGCTSCSPGHFHSYRRDGTGHRNILWMSGFGKPEKVAPGEGQASYSMLASPSLQGYHDGIER